MFHSENLIQNFQLLQNTYSMSQAMVFIKNMQRQYVAASDVYARKLGFSSAQDILGKIDDDFIHDPSLAEHYRNADQHVLRTGEDILDAMEEMKDPQGRIRYISTSKFLVRDDQGVPVGLYGIVKDETELVIAQQRYARELQNIHHMSEDDFCYLVIDLDDWVVKDRKINSKFCCTLPWEETLDETLKNLLDFVVNKPDEAFSFYSNFSVDYIHRIFRQGRDILIFEYLHSLTNGERIWMKDVIKLRIDPNSRHLMVMISIQSIAAKKKKELELQRAAQHDGLTGLLNRNYAGDRIRSLLEENPDRKEYAMFIIDVDDFKLVNDGYGHQVGDQLLIRVADALSRSFRREDILGRLGGDEFFAFMEQPRDCSCIFKRAQQIISNVQSIYNDFGDIQISVSIGVCSYPKDGLTLETLYNHADKALYQAKSNGKNQYFVYK